MAEDRRKIDWTLGLSWSNIVSFESGLFFLKISSSESEVGVTVVCTRWFAENRNILGVLSLFLPLPLDSLPSPGIFLFQCITTLLHVWIMNSIFRRKIQRPSKMVGQKKVRGD